MKKIALLSFCLYYVTLMLAATPFTSFEYLENGDNQAQHLIDHTQHNFGANNFSFYFEEEKNDFDVLLRLNNFPIYKKLIFLFKSENPKHTCFAYYLDKSITPFHQDIYILDEVFRI